jgi:general stress protein 26
MLKKALGPNKPGWKLCHNTCFIPSRKQSTTSKQVRNRQNVKTNIAFPPKNRAESFITLAGLARLM